MCICFKKPYLLMLSIELSKYILQIHFKFQAMFWFLVLWILCFGFYILFINYNLLNFVFLYL